MNAAEIMKLVKTAGKWPYSYAEFERAEKIMDDYLEDNPDDIEMWLRQATFVLNLPIADFVKSRECVEEVLEMDPTNSTALLLLANIYHFHIGIIPEEVYSQFLNARPANQDHQGMISYAKAWFFRDINKDLYAQALQQSIAECPHHVWNHFYLAQYFLTIGKRQEAYQLAKKALNNVCYIFPLPGTVSEEPCDHSDWNDIFNEEIKGTHLTFINKERIEELVEKCKE